MQSIRPFPWFDGNLDEAVTFYTSVFKNSAILSVSRAGDFGSGEPVAIRSANFRLSYQEIMSFYGVPHLKFTLTVSFFIFCDAQEEVDYYWEKLAEGGETSRCGWLSDRFGRSWQVIPKDLGIPLAAGAVTRLIGVRVKGADWYDRTLMPRIGPMALRGLLYTIVLMFSVRGGKIVSLPMDVLRIAMPLLAYFLSMFFLAFAVSKAMGFTYQEMAALSFTATGNNFELAIAVAIGTFGIASSEALATVVGPLIEVPALVALVYVSLWLKRRWFPDEPAGPRSAASSPGTSSRSRPRILGAGP